MKKTSAKLSNVLMTTLEFVRNFKKEVTIPSVQHYFTLSYSGARDRVMRLLKLKKIVRNKKTGFITIK